jgi:hypothetical protein
MKSVKRYRRPPEAKPPRDFIKLQCYKYDLDENGRYVYGFINAGWGSMRISRQNDRQIFRDTKSEQQF